METEYRQIINETAVENPTPNTEAVEKLFKDFVKFVENRLLATEANPDVKSVENSLEEKYINNISNRFRNCKRKY